MASVSLTTIFTPPASCNSIVTYDGTLLWQNGINQTGDASCFPPHFSDIYASAYSPGICPQSWGSEGSVPNPQGPLAPTAVLSMSLPPELGGRLLIKGSSSGYIISRTSNAAKLNNFCFSLMTTPLTNVVSVASLTNGSGPHNPQLTTLAESDVLSTTVYADVIRVNWQLMDSEVVALMASTAAATQSSIPSSTLLPGSLLPSLFSVPSATSSGLPSLPTSTPSSSGLSTSTKVAIGVVVPLAIIAIAALIANLFISRRRRRQVEPWRNISVKETKDGNSHEVYPMYHEPPEPTELDARALSELPGTEATPELEGRTPNEKSKMSRYFSLRRKGAIT